ncbi:hypothetical protein ABDK00_010950 [Niabella insulamsoli]|uniref:hypothetical protein n=1 Tax=Niabella insulamsoli TaxID=3144874 RepID=UPI0031FC3406
MRQMVPSARMKKYRKQIKPELEWQTGAYNRYVEWEGMLPYSFLLMAKLAGVTPDNIVSDFMDNLSCGGWKRKGREKARQHLVEYFIEHGYGQKHYKAKDIRTMFRELDAIGMLWPENGTSKFTGMHAKWRNKYYAYWFEKWYNKLRRKK